MKKRTPQTLESAVSKAKALLGAEGCAEILGVSTSMVYKLSDEQHAKSLTLLGGMQLDIACKAAADSTPVLDFYMNLIDQVEAPGNDSNNCNLQFLKMTKDIGDLSHWLAEFEDEKSQGGKNLTPNEKAELASRAEQLLTKTKRFLQCLGQPSKKAG